MTVASDPRLQDQARQALALATQGQLPIIDLFQTGQGLVEAGQRPLGLQLYRAWLAHPSPLAYAAWFNLAVMLSDHGELGEAEAAYRMALAQNPRFHEGHLNLGTLLERLRRPDEALASWRALLDYADPALPADRPHVLAALNNLGRLLEIQKDFPAAEEALTRSLRLDGRQPNVVSHWVHLRQKQCKWPVYNSAACGVPADELMRGTSALAMLGASGDPAQQLAAARRFVEEKVDAAAAPLSGPRGYGHDRLRIGYLSSDFCSHAVSILTAELYGLHDRSKVEVFGFCWSHEDGSPLRARVIAGMDHHIRIGGMGDDEAARLIRSHEIDILVDLHGLTLGARPNILARRPAPVQITWLGLPGPTGLPCIDYVIADPFVLPPELEPYFTEKPLHMPRSFQINDRQRVIGATPTRAANNLPEDAFVLCAFNNNFKFTPEVFGSWMNILKRAPHSVLWMVADSPEVRTNLTRQAELAGVAAERLVFAGRVVPADYLARYQVADLFLDTAPFNGGTTASDALWAGLPVLTCAGRTFSSRMAGSLLRAVDMEQLITTDAGQYEDLAVALAHDRPRVAALKRQLHERRLECALFDSAQFVRDLEARYAEVALKGDAGLPAPSFAGARAPGVDARLPKVSILMPTHNRPDYGELALQSILAQTWGNIEVVISDNSTDERTRERFAPYLARYPNIRYLRSPGLPPLENFLNCYHNATSDYVNYLMDDDLFHPEKVARMMACMLAQPNLSLVTSFRQLIDAEGRFLAPISGTERLFETATAVGGASLGDMMLTNGQNLIGEPTTVLFRRSMLPGHFGMFTGRQYTTLSDVATWLALLANGDCAYLPEPMSYFRLHGGQDQRGDKIRIQANIEWLQLLCDAHNHDKFIRNRRQVRELLTSKLPTCIWYLSSVHEQVPAAYDVDKINALVQQAMTIILAP